METERRRTMKETEKKVMITPFGDNRTASAGMEVWGSGDGGLENPATIATWIMEHTFAGLRLPPRPSPKPRTLLSSATSDRIIAELFLRLAVANCRFRRAVVNLPLIQSQLSFQFSIEFGYLVTGGTFLVPADSRVISHSNCE